MARTKQTSAGGKIRTTPRKSTGAPAPRVVLKGPAESNVRPATVASAANTSSTTAPASGKRKKADSAGEKQVPILARLGDAQVLPRAEDGKLDFVDEPKKNAEATPRPRTSVERNNTDTFCAGCSEGGLVAACDVCDAAWCERCVDLYGAGNASVEEVKALDFSCPSCFQKRLGMVPYIPLHDKVTGIEMCKPVPPGKLCGMRDQRHAAYRLAIVHLVLDEFAKQPSPAEFIVSNLRLGYASDEVDEKVVSHTVRFDVKTEDESTRHSKKMAELVKKLEKSDPDTIILVITTHSVPVLESNAGDVWTGLDTAMNVSEFTRLVVTPALLRSMGPRTSYVLVNSCGSTFIQPEALTGWRHLAARTKAEGLLGVRSMEPNVSRLAPFWACFFTRSVINVMSSRNAFKDALNSNVMATQHASMVLMSYNYDRSLKAGRAVVDTRVAVWSHEHLRPLGVEFPSACTACGTAFSLKLKGQPKTMEAKGKCRSCHRTETKPAEDIGSQLADCAKGWWHVKGETHVVGFVDDV